jgi:hypothetical protein
MYNNWCVLFFLVDCLLAGLGCSIPTQPSQLKSTTRTSCIFTVYLLMISYKYAQNMQMLSDEIN